MQFFIYYSKNVEVVIMKRNKGIAILLFAILFQLCSTGMEIVSLVIGVIGLVIAIQDECS